MGNESNFRVDFTENHVVMVLHLEFSNPALPAVGVEERGALRAEMCLAARFDGKPENRTLLIAEKVAVDDPTCIDTLACEFLGSDCRT